MELSAKPPAAEVGKVIAQLKKQAAIEQQAAVKAVMERNNHMLAAATTHLAALFASRASSPFSSSEIEAFVAGEERHQMSGPKMLAFNAGSTAAAGAPPPPPPPPPPPAAAAAASAAMCGGGSLLKVKTVRMPAVLNVPTYTTWNFIARNERMVADDSVLGRRRLYYNAAKDETTVCSDSDDDDDASARPAVAAEEPPDPPYDGNFKQQQQQHDFSPTQDRLIWDTLRELGACEDILAELATCLKATPSAIIERHRELMGQKSALGELELELEIELEPGAAAPVARGEDAAAPAAAVGGGIADDDDDDNNDKLEGADFETAMNSFDNIFCRRCLIFDCRLHGTGQDLFLPSDPRLPAAAGRDALGLAVPCSPQCVCLGLTTSMAEGGVKRAVVLIVDEDRVAAAAASASAAGFMASKSTPVNYNKKQKRDDAIGGQLKEEEEEDLELAGYGNERSSSRQGNGGPSSSSGLRAFEIVRGAPLGYRDVTAAAAAVAGGGSTWTPFETEIFFRGHQMFGHNSCAIATYLLKGQKTCMEVAHRFTELAAVIRAGGGGGGAGGSCLPSDAAANGSRAGGGGSTTRGDGRRRKGKSGRRGMGRLFPAAASKRLRRGKQQQQQQQQQQEEEEEDSSKEQEACRQYVPCACQGACGRTTCPCVLRGAVCEKFCGCSKKACKNSLRGCNCAKSQCKTNLCPCYAASRECDPDLCRNCWIQCGDGTLGHPLRRGDNYECRNMKLLLGQHQPVLLGRSQVTGWGAFMKVGVNKDELLGEYTGEVITHKEADRRGKIYDRVNSSFLFNLNDQNVLDAFRKGNKLKFANHAHNPNCQAKVMLVAGEHRVAIFSKKKIAAGEELFYDYGYAPDCAPDWALKDDPGKKASSGRTYVHAFNHKMA